MWSSLLARHAGGSLSLITLTQHVTSAPRAIRFQLRSLSTSSNSSSQAAMSAAKDLVENTIANHRVVIFSKSYCPYCKKAKGIFATKYTDEKPEVLELDEREDGSAIQDYLAEKTGQRTVPNIFVTQKHIGGSDAIVEADNKGRLRELLSA